MTTTPVPPVLDQTRYAKYEPVALTTDFALGFPLFGDKSDIEVRVDGVLQDQALYQVRSVANGVTLTPVPVADAFVRFNVAIAAVTVEIYGKRRPRRTVQATAPYSTRDFNVAFSDLTSVQREIFDDVKRSIKTPHDEGEQITKPRDERHNTLLGFDADGDLKHYTVGDDGYPGGVLAAELWAVSPDPIPPEAGGDGSTDRSAKYWAEVAEAQTGDISEEISAEVDFVAIGNVKTDAVLGPDALLAGKEFTLDGFAVDDGSLVLLTNNQDKTKNYIWVYDKANNQMISWSGMPVGSTINRPYAVRINQGRDYTDAVFTLATFTGIIGSTQLTWQDAEFGVGAVATSSVLAGSALPSGYPRQATFRRLANGDLPNLRPSQALAQWEPVRPAIVGLKVRKLSTYGQEATKWARQVSIQYALEESAILEIDEPCFLTGQVAANLKGKTIICHGPSVPIIQNGTISSIFDLAGAYDFTIRGHMHIRYPRRAAVRAIKLLSPSTCGRFRFDLISTEGCDYALYLTGAFTGMVRMGEVRCKDYSTDTAVLMTQSLDKCDVPRIGGLPVAGAQSLNASKTYQWGIDPQRLTLTGSMSAGRTLTLSPNNAFEGARCKIIHAASGGFNWTIQYNAVTIATLSNGQSAEFLATAGGWVVW